MEMARRPEKSTFALTCSLLSKYIKEKGSITDLGISLPSRVLDSSNLGKPEIYLAPMTMNLLPGVDVLGDDREGTKEDSLSLNATISMELFPQHAGLNLTSPPAEAKEPEKAQLTIFYGGKVLVFDNFTVDKAKDLMEMASKGQNFTPGTVNTMAPSAPVADHHSYLAPAKPPANFPAGVQPNFSDLPIARKASLHRFMQKRRDRISAQAPYHLSSRNDSKDVVTREDDQPAMVGIGATNNEARLKLQLQKLTLQAL